MVAGFIIAWLLVVSHSDHRQMWLYTTAENCEKMAQVQREKSPGVVAECFKMEMQTKVDE